MARVAADVTFPDSTGAHRVGRLALDLVDEQRPDPYARREAKRRLGVWVWYPAAPAPGSRPANYLPGWWRVLGPVWGFRPSRVRVRAVGDAPVAGNGPFPVIVFSPSANPPHFYTALLEELASHGYVVVGIAHTYETIPITAFPEGGVRMLNPKSLAGAFSTPGKRLYADDLRDRGELVGVKADDIRFVVDELARLGDGDHVLAGRLDTARLGVFGHSFGGGAAAEACRLDPRFQAGASIDGGLWRAPSSVAASGPYLQLFGEHPELTMPCAEAVSAKYYANAEYCKTDRETTVGAWQALHERSLPGKSILVRGAEHASFIDWPLLPLWRISLARRGLGAPAPGVVWRLTSDYLLDFFGEHLRGEPSSLLAGAGSDPRVAIDAPSALFRA
jgi:dienelactone hydrolase